MEFSYFSRNNIEFIYILITKNFSKMNYLYTKNLIIKLFKLFEPWKPNK
jgi:hypothetical protein